MLVVLSLCLSVVLLNVLAVFVQGFDEERYLDGNTCADFIAGPTGYFRYAPTPLDESDIEEIRAHTTASLSGAVYTLPQRAQCWRPEADVRAQAGARLGPEDLTSYLSQCAQRDGLLHRIQVLRRKPACHSVPHNGAAGHGLRPCGDRRNPE